MTIETKYNVGESVWLINENRVRQRPIFTIVIRVLDGKAKKEYFLEDVKGCYCESELFATKEELLNSL